MTKCEKMRARINSCIKAATIAEDNEMKAGWINKAHILQNELENMTIEELEKEIA